MLLHNDNLKEGKVGFSRNQPFTHTSPKVCKKLYSVGHLVMTAACL
jgi:hypothetical protein